MPAAPPPLSSEIDSGGGVFDEPVSDGAAPAAGADTADGPTTAASEAAAAAATLGGLVPRALAAAPAVREGQAAGDFTVVGGKAATSQEAKDGDYFFEGTTLHILSSTPLTVSTAKQTTHNIEINAGVKADLTLAGVNISTTTAAPINMVTNSDEDKDGVKVTDAADIEEKTMLYLTLADGSTNTLANPGTVDGWPAIRCGWGSVLVIDDSVTNVRAGGSKFNLEDIVTPENGVVGADVTLLGGKQLEAGDPLMELEASDPGVLVANGGSHCAGIGSGPRENAGTLVFNGGDISASGPRWGGTQGYGAAGIGGGTAGSGTVITINGGKIVAQAASCGSGIGAGLGYTLSSSLTTGGTTKPDAIVIPRGDENSHGYSYIATPSNGGWLCCTTGSCPAGVHHLQYPATENYFTFAGDITINGGYVDARNGGHGNAVGQSCAHGPASNRNHLIRVTGGTLLTTVTGVDGNDPPLCSVGAAFGYTIVTGGSVQVQRRSNGTAAFQGIGGTAFNTGGVEGWDDVEALGGSLPDTDKVQMLTIDLSSEFAVGENKTVPITKWKLELDNQAQNYGAPAYLNEGQLYLWLPESATGKNVTVTMSYLDDAGEEHDIEPMYVEEIGGDEGSTLKRYIDIVIDKLPDDQKEYFSGLSKDYDGLEFEVFDVGKNPIDTTPFEANGKTLDDPTAVEVSYQAYAAIGDELPIEGAPVVKEGKMPADSGVFKFQLVSKQHATGTFGNAYWGHRITGWSEVRRVPAVLKIDEKDGTAWVRLKKQADDSYDYELVKETDKDPGTHLRVAFTVRSAKGTAVTCKAPTGKFQVLIDGKPVGEPIELTEEAMRSAPGSTLTITEGAKSASENTPGAIAGEANRWETHVEYFLDPTRLDGALDAADVADQGNTHQVTVRYIPDKNYVESTEENPDNEASKPTTIVPVKPEGDATPDDPGKVEVKPSPNPDPGPGGIDPDDPTGKMQVVRKTVTVRYGDFHKEGDDTLDDFFKMALTSTSSAPASFAVSNTAVADLVRGEGGEPSLDGDGKLQIRVNSCGTSVVTVEQRANALFSGIKYILTVNVLPDPSIRPQIQIRLTWRNLTALEEAGGEPAMALAARGLAAVASGEGASFAARAAGGRASTPPRPGDVLEYTVTGLNLTPGSAWQAAELRDAIDQKLSFDAESVEIASNYATHSNAYDLGTAAFYDGFDWDDPALGWEPVDRGGSDGYEFDDATSTLTKGIGTVYGGQSTSVRFQAKVGEDEGLGDRPTDGKLPEIANEPSGGGEFGKPEGDLRPGETPSDPEPLNPGTDIEIVGDGDRDPETGEFPDPEPIPVLPKDPAAADILTTVDVGLKEHREEHDGDRFMVGDTLEVTVTTTNRGADSKLANAVMRATLPLGVEPVPDSIRLVLPDGTEIAVPDSAYDPKTGILAVNAGDLYGGESVRLVFDVEVVSTSETRDPSEGNPGGRPEGPAIEGGALGETPTDEWEREHPMVPNPDDPDGPLVPGDPDSSYEKPEPGTPFEPSKPWDDLEDELVTSPPATDPDMPPVLPANPKLEGDADGPADIELTKTAENESRNDGTTCVGDTVRYTVTLSNSKPHTMWYGAVIRDAIPKGLEPLAGTIRVTAPDGSVREVSDSAYDPATRVLAVAVGDLAGGRTAVLSFACEVTAEALGVDIGNVASAHGTRPSDADPSEVAPGVTRPTPGEPFHPSEGWDSFLRNNPGVDNADKPAYAPGTDSKGGVLSADGQGGDGDDSGTRISLAQTGDELLGVAGAAAALALAAGALLLAVRRRMRA